MRDLALLVSHVEKDLVMGITPHELRYGPLQSDCLGHVVEVCPVVRERGAGNQKQTDGQSSGGGQSIPHVAVHGNSSPVQFPTSSLSRPRPYTSRRFRSSVSLPCDL